MAAVVTGSRRHRSVLWRVCRCVLTPSLCPLLPKHLDHSSMMPQKPAEAPAAAAACGCGRALVAGESAARGGPERELLGAAAAAATVAPLLFCACAGPSASALSSGVRGVDVMAEQRGETAAGQRQPQWARGTVGAKCATENEE